MTAYQHLLILFPALTMMFWGFYARESTTTIVIALLGFAVIVGYMAWLVYPMLLTLICLILGCN